MASEANDPPDSLEGFLAHRATSIVRKVIGYRLGASCPEQDDICAQVLLELTTYVRNAPASAPGDADAFARYVAVAAHHGCDHYLRRKYPLRWRLRNRVRYLLAHDRRFGLWKGVDGLWWCGRRGTESAVPGALVSADDLESVDHRQLGRLLEELFLRSGGPLQLTDVVEIAGSVWHVPRVAERELAEVGEVVDIRPRADRVIEEREKAERAWLEIRSLPVPQREALLLNLKHDAMNFLVTTGIASLRAIAATLEMPVPALAALWNDLPLSDNVIASRLGCTRQQVINLRTAARKRLANRLAGWS